MLNNDITDTGVDEQYFVVNWESLGVNHEHLLCPNGDQIKLSESNKSDYINKYLTWRFTRGTKEQYDSFISGLSEIVPISMLRDKFDDRELELVVSGLGKFLSCRPGIRAINHTSSLIRIAHVQFQYIFITAHVLFSLL